MVEGGRHGGDGATPGPVTMRVAEVRRRPGGDGEPEKTVILLREAPGERRLCIWVGASRPSRSPSPRGRRAARP